MLKKLLIYLLINCLINQPLYAAVIADGSTNSRIHRSANGTEIIDIANPDNKGVSQNNYQRFDIDSKGLIINNSRQQTDTHLAGYVEGNPHLNNNASLIINQVTSNNISQLDGYLEVAGSKAQVIIANPYGITCNGCGFINTSRLSLITGTNSYNPRNGNLLFNLNNTGELKITGKGINATDTAQLADIDNLELISRYHRIYAPIHAKQLQIKSGNNSYNYHTKNISSDNNTNTGFAVDAGSYGSIYADAIQIHATEKGLGVNTQADLISYISDIDIGSAGSINYHNLHSAGNALLTASDNITQKTSSQAQNISYTTQADINIHGTQLATNNITHRAQNINLQQHTTDDIIYANNIQLTADNSLNNHSHIYSTTYTDIDTTTLNNHSQINTQGTLNIKSTALNNTLDATIAANKHLAIDSQHTISNNGTMGSLETIKITSGDLANSGQITATDIHISNSNNTSNSGNINSTQSLTINTAQTLDNTSNITANYANLTNHNLSNSGSISADILKINTTDTIDNTGNIINDTDLTTTSNTLTNSGTIHSNSNANITTDNSIDNSGKLTSSDTLTLSSGDITNSGTAEIAAATQLEINSSGKLDNNGDIASNNKLNLTAETIDNTGNIIAGTDLTTTSNTLTNSGTIHSNSIANITATTSINNTGKLTSSDNLTLTSGDITNHSTAEIAAGNQLEINASNNLNNNGDIASSNNLTLNATTIDNTSNIIAGTDLTTTATTLTNNGTIHSNSNANITADNSIDNTGKLTSSDTLTLTSGDITNSGTAEIAAATQLDLNSSGKLTNQGEIQSNRQLNLTAETIDNTGKLTSQDATINTQSYAKLGSIDSINGNLDITADTLDYQHIINNGDLNIQANNSQLNNLIHTGGNVTINIGNQLTNHAQIYADGNIYLQARSLNNHNHIASLNANLHLNTTGTINNHALLYSEGNSTINAHTLNNYSDILSQKHLWLGTHNKRINTITNHASNIEAHADIHIYANTLNNNASGNVKIKTNEKNESVTDYRQRTSGSGKNIGETWNKETHTIHTYQEQQDPNLNQANIQSGGNINLHQTTLNNTNSHVKARHSLNNYNSTLNDHATALTKAAVEEYTQDAGSKEEKCGKTFSASRGYRTKWCINYFTDYKHRQATSTIGHIHTTLSGGHSITGTVKSLNNQSAADHQQHITAQPISADYQNHLSRIADRGYTDPLANIKIPTKDSKGLFRPATRQSGTHHYLIETAIQFTDRNQYVGTDYYKQKMGIDPDKIIRTLGDNYYTHKQIEKQLYSINIGQAQQSVEQQTHDLIAQAALAKDKLELVPGIALSVAQQQELTQDILWYEEMDIPINGNNQKVWIPKIYLGQDTLARLARAENHTGAVIQAANIDLLVAGDINNTGTIRAGNNLKLTSQNDINNLGGVISSGGNLQLAAEGDINNISTTENNLASITATNLSLDAGGSITNTAAALKATGDITLTATGKIDFNTLAHTNTHVSTKDNTHTTTTTTTHSTSTLAAGGNLKITGGDLSLTATAATAGGVADIDVNSIKLATATNTSESRSKSSSRSGKWYNKKTTTTTTTGSTSDTISSGITAGSGIKVQAKQDITLTAAKLKTTQGDIALATTGGKILIQDAVDTNASHTKSSTKGTTSKKTLDKGHIKQTANSSSLTAESGNVILTAGADSSGIELVGGKLQGQQNLVVENNSKHQVKLATTELTNTQWHIAKKEKRGLATAGAVVEANLKKITDSDGTGVEIATETGSRTTDVTNDGVKLEAENIAITSHNSGIELQNTKLTASGDIALTAKDDIAFTTAVDTNINESWNETENVTGQEIETSDRRISSATSYTKNKTHSLETSTTNRGSELQASNISINSDKGDVVAINLDATASNIDIAADDVTIGSVADTYESKTTNTHQEIKVSQGIGNAYNDVAQSAKDLKQAGDAVKQAEGALAAAKKDPQVHSEDLKYYEANLAAATANLAAASAKVVQDGAKAAGSTKFAGFYADVQVDISENKSVDYSKSTSHQGSRLLAGNLNIKAKNNTTIQGSDIAASNINLESKSLDVLAVQDETYSSSSSDTKSVSYNQGTAGSGTVSGSVSGSRSSSSAVSNKGSQLMAGNLVINADDAIQISGSNLQAQQVDITTGSLSIESLQDSYSSKTVSQGVNGGSSGGVGANYSKDTRESRWVNNQASITGNKVNITTNKLDNTAAVIASTDGEGHDNGQLNLTADSISVADLADSDVQRSLGAGFSTNVNSRTDAKTTTLSAHYKGRSQKQGTIATIGQGDVFTNSTVLGVNRDINEAQQLTEDRKLGGLDATLVIDHKTLSADGRQSLKRDVDTSLDHAEEVYTSGKQVVTSEEIGIGDFASLVNDKAQVRQGIRKIHNTEAADKINDAATDARGNQEALSKVAQITSEDSATQVSLYDEGENGIEKLKGFHDPKDGVIGINTRTTDMTSAADKVEVAAHEGYHRQLDNPSYGTETEEALADDMGKRAARYWQQENDYKGVDSTPRVGVDNSTWNQANASSGVIAKGNLAVAGKRADEVETLTMHVNGTNLFGKSDMSIDPDLKQAVSETFNEPVVEGKWSGENTPQARREAAEKLLEIVENHEFKEGETFNLSGHSHGGNVIKEFTQIYDSDKKGKKIDTVVYLATGHRKDHKLDQTDLAPDAKLINLYDKNDLVQSPAAGVDLDFTIKNTNDGMSFDGYLDMVEIPQKRLEQATNIEIQQKKQLKVDSINLYSEVLNPPKKADRIPNPQHEIKVKLTPIESHTAIDSAENWNKYIKPELKK